MTDSPLPGASASHLIALDTYGTQKVMLRATKQQVTAIKCTRAVPDVLRALFGTRAIDVTPPGSSYHYIQLTVPYHLKQSYLLLKLTDDELAQVEALTRQQPLGAWVYLWRDGHWLEFPCGSHPEYRLASATSSLTYPRFSASSSQAICPSTLGTMEGSVPNAPTANGRELTIERNGDWWWIGGDTYAHREILKAAGARWSKTRQQWYIIGAVLPKAIQALAHPTDTPSDSEGATALPTTGNPEMSSHEAKNSAMPSQPLSIEVVQDAQPSESQIPVAIQPAPAMPVIPALPTGIGGRIIIPQRYIGRVNVVGDCYCLGAVLDRRPPSYKNIPIYLSVAGPATSVEAVWARLSQGKETTIVPDNTSPAIYLEPNKAGLYTRYQKKIEALGIDHLVLIHEDLAEPSYQADADVIPMTYILCLSEAQQLAKLGEHIRKTVKIVVFDEWLAYLYQEGLNRGLLRRCTGYAIEGLSIKLEAAKWTEVITGALADGRITLP